MGNGIAGLDHVIIAVRDLERARMGWIRLGFTLTPRATGDDRHLALEPTGHGFSVPRTHIEKNWEIGRAHV